MAMHGLPKCKLERLQLLAVAANSLGEKDLCRDHAWTSFPLAITLKAVTFCMIIIA